MLQCSEINFNNTTTLTTLTIPHLQNKDKSGGLEVLQEFGHNENEEGSNEDPGVNSDNEEDDEFKVLYRFFLHI